MIRSDAVDEAVSLLVKRRNEALAEVLQIEKALSDLGHPVSAEPPVGQRRRLMDPPPIPLSSVRGKVLALLIEEDRDWSVGEIITAYERRGEPFTVKNVDNAIRAALVETQKKGQVVRTAIGRYKSATFEPGEAGRQWNQKEVLS